MHHGTDNKTATIIGTTTKTTKVGNKRKKGLYNSLHSQSSQQQQGKSSCLHKILLGSIT
jgi:hypothetical protein